jgi:tRNA(Ile)-lysidine synthase
VNVAARLVDRVRHCWRSLEDGARGLVVAVSGGPDSVALARAVLEAREEQPVVLAHLNHLLRGTESEEDEAFVVALHARFSACASPLHLERERLDVRELAIREGENLEALARRERYRWLAEVARRHGIRWVATGHTANDQAETVLHRLLRGTGLQGLRGIAVKRELEPGVGLVRPLLRTTRDEVLAALAEWDQPARRDASNDDLSLTRNRIRHELLPHLAEEYNPAVVEVLTRLAEQAEEAYREEESAFRDLLLSAELPRAGAVLIFDLQRLCAATRRLVRGAFRLVWAREKWPTAGMSYEAWERLADVVFAETQAVDLPGMIHFRRRDRVVQLTKRTGIAQEAHARLVE